MIKFDLNSNLIADSHITPQKENFFLTKHTGNKSSKNLSLISIQNVDTTLPKQCSIPPSPNSLMKELHHIENNTDTGPPFSVSTSDKRLKNYLHQNHTLINRHTMLLALEATLSHKQIKKTQYAEVFKELLSSLRLVEKAFMPYSLQAQLTPSQRTEINQREGTIQELITCFCMLSDILLNAQKMEAHTHPLLSPLYKERNDNIKHLEKVIANSRNLINQSHTPPNLPSPISIDITCAPHTILQKMACLIDVLKKRPTNGVEEQLLASVAKTLIPPSSVNKTINNISRVD